MYLFLVDWLFDDFQSLSLLIFLLNQIWNVKHDEYPLIITAIFLSNSMQVHLVNDFLLIFVHNHHDIKSHMQKNFLIIFYHDDLDYGRKELKSDQKQNRLVRACPC